MGRFLKILLAIMFGGGSLLAQPAPPPPLPIQTPVDFFRRILEMPAAEQAKSVAARSAEARAFLESKLKEFQALSPAAREARLQTLQLRWFMLPLMKVAPEQRGPRLKLMSDADRKLVEERLAEWDQLPADLQKQIIENESVIRLFFRSETNAPTIELVPTKLTPQQREKTEQDLARWNSLPEAEQEKIKTHFERFLGLNEKEKDKILGRMTDPERQQMERTLRSFDRLPKNQRELCLRNFQKFAALSPEERQEFLANAERWQSISAQDRQLWRDLVARLQPKPPLPPGLRPKSPPLPPGPVPKPPTSAATARVTN